MIYSRIMFVAIMLQCRNVLGTLSESDKLAFEEWWTRKVPIPEHQAALSVCAAIKEQGHAFTGGAWQFMEDNFPENGQAYNALKANITKGMCLLPDCSKSYLDEAVWFQTENKSEVDLAFAWKFTQNKWIFFREDTTQTTTEFPLPKGDHWTEEESDGTVRDGDGVPIPEGSIYYFNTVTQVAKLKTKTEEKTESMKTWNVRPEDIIGWYTENLSFDEAKMIIEVKKFCIEYLKIQPKDWSTEPQNRRRRLLQRLDRLSRDHSFDLDSPLQTGDGLAKRE